MDDGSIDDAGRVLAGPAADHTGVHPGDHLRAVRAGGVRAGGAEAALARGTDHAAAGESTTNGVV